MSRQRLGQHYLIDSGVVEEIISAAKIKPDERVLEIGTGRGALTRELARLGSSLEGYEVDEENLAVTIGELGTKSAVIHLGDAFKETPRFDVLVSSLPYSRSANFIEWISQVEYDRAVVLLQEDFVAKVLAVPGARNYRAVSVVGQVSSEFRVLMRVGRKAFSPPPRINSVLVLVRPKRRLTRAEILWIKRLFSLRRREVASAAAELGMVLPRTLLRRRRVYSLTPDEVLDIRPSAQAQLDLRKVILC